MNKKYLPSALILYLNYFIHGVDALFWDKQLLRTRLQAHGALRQWQSQQSLLHSVSAV